MNKNTVREFLYNHLILCALLLVISGISAGAITLDLFRIILANLQLFSDYGIKTAFKLGAGRQAIELLGYGTLAMCFYVLFKLAESVLVLRLGDIKLKKIASKNK